MDATQYRSKKWFETPFTWLIIFVLTNLVVGIFIVSDYGISSDEFIDRLRSNAALKAYSFSSDVDLAEHYLSLPSTIRFYGTAQGMLFEAAEQSLAPILDTLPGTIRHYGYFFSFQVAIVSIYFLTSIFTSQWVSLAVSLIFGTQPLLFGHAFINPKDIPLLAIFTAVVASGFHLSRKFQVHSHLHPIQYSYVNWLLAKDEIKRLASPQTVIGLMLLFASLTLGRVFRAQITSSLAKILFHSPENTLRWKMLQLLTPEAGGASIEVSSQKIALLINQGINILAGILVIGLIFFLMIQFRKKNLIVNSEDYSFSEQTTTPHPRLPLSIYLAAAVTGALWGFAVATRVIGLAAGGIVGICLLVEFRRKAILPLIAYTISAGLVCYFVWPFLWAFGFPGLIDSIDTLLRFPSWDGVILFEGEFFPARTLPPYFMIKLIALQLTLPVVLCSIFGGIIGLYELRNKPDSRIKILLLFAWFGLPVLITALSDTVQYDNFRQYLFILPPLFVFFGIFLNWLTDKFKQRWIISAVTLFCIIPAIISLVQLHPFQYIHYNALTGGVEGAFRDYHLDYWLTSYMPAAEWIDDNIPSGSSILIWDWVGEMRVRHYIENDFELVVASHVSPEEYSSIDYVLVTTELNLDIIYHSAAEPLFILERDNVPLVMVMKNGP